MKLGLQLGYWGAQPPTNHAELVSTAEEVGFDTVFTAEAWGSDAYTPLAWWGRETTRMRLGTSVIQLSARTPTACAMAALTLDHLSGGRHILGLGVSGPQVVEGWYGQKFPKPLARTREYIDIIRQVWAREAPVHSDGPHYPLPLTGEGTTGLGKNLKPITHPLRPDIPIMLGAEGPKNVALAAEIADGWLPIFYSPRIATMYNEWLDEGFARPGARRTRETFEICATLTRQRVQVRHATALEGTGYAEVVERLRAARIHHQIDTCPGQRPRAAQPQPPRRGADQRAPAPDSQIHLAFLPLSVRNSIRARDMASRTVRQLSARAGFSCRN